MKQQKKKQGPAQPRNVQAIVGWYRRHKTADDVAAITRLFNPPPGPPSPVQLTMEALVLQGFEAGREYQHAHPDADLTGTYMAKLPQRGVDEVVEELSPRFESVIDVVTLDAGLSLEQAADVADQVAAGLKERARQLIDEANRDVE